MLLRDLLNVLDNKQLIGSDELEITGLAHHSKEVQPGYLFVAVPGLNTDGAKFIPDAIERGALAVVVQSEIKVPKEVALVIVPSARSALALLSAQFHGFPSRKMNLIGVTGTNGKTTTTFLIHAILSRAGIKAGLIGTVGAWLGDKQYDIKLTTPDALDLQRLLADMLEQGARFAVTEVSSHALSQDRVLGCEFKVGIFTNLTHDHLDFHKSMQDYLAAKLKLFHLSTDGATIVNLDDPASEEIIKHSGRHLLTYGIREHTDVVARDIHYDLNGTFFSVKTPKQKISLKTRLVGDYNIYNILAAITCGIYLGIDLEVIKAAIEGFAGVPGRLEFVDCGQDFKVAVDFAHSPDSLEKMLNVVRRFRPSYLILVFGCTGDRDQIKRPIMGQIASRLADYTILTTDDPHREDPGRIIDEIEKGMEPGARYDKIVDRRSAIISALQKAGPGDIVILAGRGHEVSQDFSGKKVMLDDREVVRDYLCSFLN
jgi:UDP-N-acetylmuramoyl-L-alanyl-D-glutamate--2,6-diaminopimelate ligase